MRIACFFIVPLVRRSIQRQKGSPCTYDEGGTSYKIPEGARARGLEVLHVGVIAVCRGFFYWILINIQYESKE